MKTRVGVPLLESEREREVNGCEMVCMGRRMYSSEVEPV